MSTRDLRVATVDTHIHIHSSAWCKSMWIDMNAHKHRAPCGYERIQVGMKGNKR